MKALFYIARNEFARLFFSPIAWALLIVFSVRLGMTFTDALNSEFIAIDMGYPTRRPLTQDVFFGPYTIFQELIQWMFLYIPLLTMNVFSREFQSGSIQLLTSSPVRIAEIVLGKYLAVVGFCLLLSLVHVYVLVVAVFYIEAVDTDWVLASIFGLFLANCLYAAIGVFMSSLTKHPVVAALSTLAVLGSANMLHKLQTIPPSMHEIFQIVSPFGRLSQFGLGVVAVPDIVYFVVGAGLFVTLTIFKLSNQRFRQRILTGVVRAASAIGASAILIYLAMDPSRYRQWDATQIQSNTLTDDGRRILREIDGNWRVTSYVNIARGQNVFSLHLASEVVQQLLFFRLYLAENSNATFDTVYFYNLGEDSNIRAQRAGLSDEEIARELAGEMGVAFRGVLSPEDARARAQLNTLPERDFQILEWNGKTQRIPVIHRLDYLPPEMVKMAGFRQLLEGPARARFATGHGERRLADDSIESYRRIALDRDNRAAMINLGFDVDTVSLALPVPDDTDLLIIADPDSEYSDDALWNILRYVEAGGNLLIVGDPGSRNYLQPILDFIGIKYEPEQVFQSHPALATEAFGSEVVLAQYADDAAELGIRYPPQYRLEPLVLSETGRLSYSETANFTVVPILVTKPSVTWHERYVERDMDQPAVFDASKHQRSEDVLALAAHRNVNGKLQRIAVIADADFMSNGIMNDYNRIVRHRDFIHDLFRWLSNNRYPVNIDRIDYPDRQLFVHSLAEITRLKLFMQGVLPGLLITMSGFLLYRRRRA